jgi:MFS family permease
MIKRILYRLLRHRHFWRDASFDELSQIYISTFFRVMAVSLVGIFIPIFLYDLGHSLLAIFLFYVTYFIARAVLHVPTAFIVARFGPKHTILYSFGLLLLSSLAFMTLPEYSWPLWLLATLYAASNTLFFTAYHVDFSKVKHSDHGGKETGFANIVQRVGGAVGPLVGGIIATIFGPQYIFVAMTAMLLIGIVPLITSGEAVKTRQKISFRNLRLSAVKRDILSYAGITITHQLSVTIWPLYLALFALGTNVYLELGTLSSVGFLVSIFTAFAIGKLVDKRRGRELLHISLISDMFIQFSKPFVNSLPFAFVVNTAGESSAIAMRIAYQKGMYDAADDLPGNRIIYISVMEAWGALIKSLSWVLLIAVGVLFSFEIALIVGFFLAGLANLLTMTEKFRGL